MMQLLLDQGLPTSAATLLREVGLDTEVLIHYHEGFCTLLPKGIIYVEQKIPFKIVV